MRGRFLGLPILVVFGGSVVMACSSAEPKRTFEEEAFARIKAMPVKIAKVTTQDDEDSMTGHGSSPAIPSVGGGGAAGGLDIGSFFGNTPLGKAVGAVGGGGSGGGGEATPTSPPSAYGAGGIGSSPFGGGGVSAPTLGGGGTRAPAYGAGGIVLRPGGGASGGTLVNSLCRFIVAFTGKLTECLAGALEDIPSASGATGVDNDTFTSSVSSSREQIQAAVEQLKAECPTRLAAAIAESGQAIPPIPAATLASFDCISTALEQATCDGGGLNNLSSQCNLAVPASEGSATED